MTAAAQLVHARTSPSLPALIAGAGKPASLRFLEFFTVNIRNPNTRAAYARAAGAFLGWCDLQGVTSLAGVQPVLVCGLC